MHAPDIRQLPAKSLVGLTMRMTHTADQTPSLWRSFMPRRAEIEQLANPQLYALQVYPADYFKAFDPARPFDKWAAVEVTVGAEPPEGMALFTIPAGTYAVFHYQGPGGDPSIFRYIFGTWLPNSAFELADRPHFEVLGPQYKPNDPKSTEEIWIPIQPKAARQETV